MAKKNQSVSTSTSNAPKKWLLMVYMEAGDDSNLDSLAVQDLIELQDGIQGPERLKTGGGTERTGGNSDVIALVQMKRKWPDLPQRFYIGWGGPVENVGPKRYEPTNPKDLLKAFVSEGLDVGADKGVNSYCLVLWGHNFGLGFGRDHHVPLVITELGEAISEALSEGNKKHPANKVERLDLLATNSCTMAYVEAAYQLKDVVRFLVASQIFMPPKGFPYRPIVRSIHAGTDASTLAGTFVEEYVNSFATSPDGEKVAMSLLDLNSADQFKDKLAATAKEINVFMKQGRSQKALREIQDVFLANLVGDTRPVIDLQSLAQNLIDYCDDGRDSGQSKKASGVASVTTPPTGLKDAVEALWVASSTEEARARRNRNRGNNKNQNKKSAQFVLKSRANPDLGPLGGVGVFAPFVVDTAMRTLLELESDDARQAYRTLAIFEGNEDWPDLVYDTLRRDEPDEIVSASGNVEPAERKLVNQMVGAVDAVFNIFDRVLKVSGPRLIEMLSEKPTRNGGKTKNGKDTEPFGPPRLKLVGDLSMRALGKGLQPARVSPGIVNEFERIERALTLVETTVKGVMTNSVFGLGPPVKSDSPLGPPVKSDSPLGAPVKSDSPLGAPVKSDSPLGAPVKSDSPLGSSDVGAEWGALTAFLSSDTQVAMLCVMVLFRALASVLGNLEAAVSNIEFAAAQCRLETAFGSSLSKDDYKEAMEQRFERLFDVAAEAALHARRTARQVMAHPVYGLGRGPDDFGQPQRDQLAINAGLSRRQLALL